jgi:LuxR family maltose regulon positive regulatory protein
MLISTKLHTPLGVGRLTQRPRLDIRLDEIVSSGNSLMQVIAPAGFGKSTLVSAWLRKQKIAWGWLSLDSSDNDAGQFLVYLVGSLQKVDPALGASQMNRIQTAESADSEAVYADVMANLVNEMAAQPKPFILILDDCHVLKSPLVLWLLDFLVDNQPDVLRLVMISREELPLPAVRRRSGSHIIEIRQNDLQFSPEEAQDFLCVGMGITELTSSDVLVLDQRTEGWIAGLQLAGLSIRSDPDPGRFIRSFTGSERYIQDYFMEEVFTRQPEEIRSFLLASSQLDRFCAQLCDAVLRELSEDTHELDVDSQAMLERLEHSNLFLIPLDDHRQWYRFHHLFSDLLRHALETVRPEKIPGLQLQASRWLEANGYIREAVQHAFKTQDWTYAAELVERHAWNMILHSQVGTVSEWCNTFPEEVISKRPALCIFHGWALIIAFKHSDFPAANARIQQAQAVLTEIDPQATIGLLVGGQPINLLAWVTGHLTLLRSFILMAASRREADPQALDALGKLSYEQLPPEDVTGRSVGLLDMSYASQARSDAKDAECKFEHAMEIALSGGNYFGAIVAEYHRAHGLFVQGRLRETIEFCEQKRKAYEGYFEHPLQELPALALLDQAQGCALFELNELEQAELLLRKGLQVGQWMPREELSGYLTLARLCFVKGDLEGMEETYRRLDMRWPDIRFCTQAMRIFYGLLSCPDDEEAQSFASAWVDTHPPEIGPGIIIPGISPAFYDEGDHAVFVAWAKIQILLGRAELAIGVIQPMLKVAQDNGLAHRIIELTLLESQAFFLQGKDQQSLESLQTALSHARPFGYLRLVDCNPVLTRLLEHAMEHGIMPDFIARLVEIDTVSG